MWGMREPSCHIVIPRLPLLHARTPADPPNTVNLTPFPLFSKTAECSKLCFKSKKLQLQRNSFACDSAGGLRVSVFREMELLLACGHREMRHYMSLSVTVSKIHRGN